jgi:hypothetical protein
VTGPSAGPLAVSIGGRRDPCGLSVVHRRGACRARTLLSGGAETPVLASINNLPNDVSAGPPPRYRATDQEVSCRPSISTKHAPCAATMSGAEEPLIANPDRSDDLDHDDDRGETESQNKQADGASPGLFIWLLAFSAGISGLLFGCECSRLWWYRFLTDRH